MLLKKNLYYVIHTEKCNLFSTQGYVICYLDKKLSKEYACFDLNSFYSYFKLDKQVLKKFNLICKGGVYDL